MELIYSSELKSGLRSIILEHTREYKEKSQSIFIKWLLNYTKKKKCSKDIEVL
jgi:hypothetical protein